MGRERASCVVEIYALVEPLPESTQPSDILLLNWTAVSARRCVIVSNSGSEMSKADRRAAREQTGEVDDL